MRCRTAKRPVSSGPGSRGTDLIRAVKRLLWYSGVGSLRSNRIPHRKVERPARCRTADCVEDQPQKRCRAEGSDCVPRSTQSQAAVAGRGRHTRSGAKCGLRACLKIPGWVGRGSCRAARCGRIIKILTARQEPRPTGEPFFQHALSRSLKLPIDAVASEKDRRRQRSCLAGVLLASSPACNWHPERNWAEAGLGAWPGQTLWRCHNITIKDRQNEYRLLSQNRH